MKTAKKYLNLLLKQNRQLANAKKYEQGYHYNPERRANWEGKANQTGDAMQVLEDQMTHTEKQELDYLLGCDYFFTDGKLN